MISIRYTAPHDIELAGDASGLEFISNAVKQIWASPGAALRVMAQPVNPAPYSKALQMLRIRVDDGLLHVLVLGEHLIITGNTAGLEALCASLDGVAAGSPGSHHHLEYHDGHTRIDPKSVPLVVMHK